MPSLFEAYVTNLGKYNEGELVGETLKFPATTEEVQALLKRIGVDGVRYEEIFITSFDGDVLGLYDYLGEYENLDELNHLAHLLSDMDTADLEKFEAVIDSGEYTGSVQELINLTQNLDCFDFEPGISNDEELGRRYIQDFGAVEIPEHLIDYIDYEAYGRDIAIEEGGNFTEFGYVRDTGDRFYEKYDGNPENIPEEYRVKVYELDEEKLSEADRVDMATDIAYDLDDFFRQHDPQYAAQRPEPQEQKELIADLL